MISRAPARSLYISLRVRFPPLLLQGMEMLKIKRELLDGEVKGLVAYVDQPSVPNLT